jgi:hypothetical protein
MPIRIGDRVALKDDPRHVGRVEAVFASRTIRVKWQDTGWVSDVEVDEIEKVQRS